MRANRLNENKKKRTEEVNIREVQDLRAEINNKKLEWIKVFKEKLVHKLNNEQAMVDAFNQRQTIGKIDNPNDKLTIDEIKSALKQFDEAVLKQQQLKNPLLKQLEGDFVEPEVLNEEKGVVVQDKSLIEDQKTIYSLGADEKRCLNGLMEAGFTSVELNKMQPSEILKYDAALFAALAEVAADEEDSYKAYYVKLISKMSLPPFPGDASLEIMNEMENFEIQISQQGKSIILNYHFLQRLTNFYHNASGIEMMDAIWARQVIKNENNENIGMENISLFLTELNEAEKNKDLFLKKLDDGSVIVKFGMVHFRVATFK
jgi:hypothetical protein